MAPEIHCDADRLIGWALGLNAPTPAEQTHLEGCAECERRLLELRGERVRAELAAPTPPRHVPRYLALAAMLILGVATSLWLWTSRTQPPVQQAALERRLPVDVALVEVRSSSDDAEREKLLSALAAYERGDLDGAIAGFEAIDARSRYDGIRLIYLASALALVDEHRRVDAILDELDVPTLPQPWRDRAMRVEIVSAERRGDLERARRVRSALEDPDSH